MIEVQDLEPHHLASIKLRPYEKKSIEAFHAEMSQIATAAVLGPASAFVRNGEVLAIGGFANLWGGVWEAWLLSAESIEVCGLSVARAIKKRFREVDAELGAKIQRLQAQAPVSHASAHKWIEWLGLAYESTARKYTITGEDALIYARIR